MHLRRYGFDGLEDILLHALLYSLAYDAQSEGNRGEWLVRMIDDAGASQNLYARFIDHIQRAPAEDCKLQDHWQRAAILEELVKQDEAGAREALYKLFLENLRRAERAFVGAFAIIEVDGAKGFLRVCSALGSEALAKGTDAIEVWLVDVFDEDHGEGEAIRVLDAARESDPGIEHFLSIREAEQARSERDSLLESADSSLCIIDDRLGLTAAEVIDRVQSLPGDEIWHPHGAEERGWLRRWGMRASESDLEQILSALEGSDSAVEQCRYLSVFNHRGAMPRISDEIVALAESSDERVRYCAYQALDKNSDPRIRDAGLRSLTPNLIRKHSLKLMQSNYTPGDNVALEQAIYLPDDVEELHTLVYDLARVCAYANDAECLALMLFVYEYSPCGNCRGKVVETMIELGIAPGWLVEECCFDAMDEIRERCGGTAG
jgi:hypothetical protein